MPVLRLACAKETRPRAFQHYTSYTSSCTKYTALESKCQVLMLCSDGEIRTHTVQVLNLSPPAVGLRRHLSYVSQVGVEPTDNSLYFEYSRFTVCVLRHVTYPDSDLNRECHSVLSRADMPVLYRGIRDQQGQVYHSQGTQSRPSHPHPPKYRCRPCQSRHPWSLSPNECH